MSAQQTEKYKDVKRSAKDLMRLSDDICRENGLLMTNGWATARSLQTAAFTV